ncbi:MAG: hypothetical protein IT381_16805 [Deltaproteobacteria bacterium]|nr:hypothetical protein [Deltaproteobacteria bacterium]
MTEDEKRQRWASAWQRADQALRKIEAAAAAGIDTQTAVAQLMPAFAIARAAAPHTTTSGLVEFRRLVDGAHRRG